MEPRVILETDEVVALDKPAGLIVHSDGRTNEPSLAEWLAKERPECKGVGEAWVSPQGERIEVNGIVHRLDRSTSGVILAAKSNEMFAYLRSEFKAKRVQKEYRAIVYGAIADSGEIVAEIARTSVAPRRWYAKPCERSDVRAAITEWRLIQRLDNASYIAVTPRTGRTHQIRVHLASIGYPLVADHLYAPEIPPRFGFTRPALHALRISFAKDGATYEATAPLPPDFRGCGLIEQ